MTCRLALAILSALSLVGCEAKRPDSRDATIAKLRSDLQEVRGRVTLLEDSLEKSKAEANDGATLVVSWPGKGGNDYRRDYTSLPACQQVRDDLAAKDLARREAASEQQRAEAAAAGYRIVVGSAAPAISAECIPH